MKSVPIAMSCALARRQTRDPFLLVGRTPRPGFTIADLASARIATVSECADAVALPAARFTARRDRPGTARPRRRLCGPPWPTTSEALRAGAVDVVQLFQPLAEELIEEGSGHLWYAAASRGPCSYTTFYARRGTLAAKRDEFPARPWCAGSTARRPAARQLLPGPLADTVQGYFADVPRARLVAALARYKALSIWGRTPVLPRDGYERLKDGLHFGRLRQGHHL